jgi:hypothetical protein
MQHLRTLNLLFSGTPQFRFNRHQNKVFLDIDWTRDVQPGNYVIIECYRALEPETIALTGTLSCTPSSNTVTGTGTKFDQELVDFDFITIGTEQKQVRKISSPTSLELEGNTAITYTNATAVIEGVTDIWNDRFLKKYATALIKRQWGSNLKKFAGIQMPGGVTLNGQLIYDEAIQEIDKMEEEIYMMGSLPSEILTG